METATRPTFPRLLASSALAVSAAVAAAIPLLIVLALAFGLAYAADETDASGALRGASGVLLVAAFVALGAGTMAACLLGLREAATRLTGWRPDWVRTVVAAWIPSLGATYLLIDRLEPTPLELAALAAGWALVCALVLRLSFRGRR